MRPVIVSLRFDDVSSLLRSRTIRLVDDASSLLHLRTYGIVLLRFGSSSRFSLPVSVGHPLALLRRCVLFAALEDNQAGVRQCVIFASLEDLCHRFWMVLA
jgi:hypothetical protein